jgi:trehalose 6-phosphate synthase
MAGRRKLIVVSNRGPVTFERDRGGERVARRGGGGLVTALRSLVYHHDVTWIASAMTDEDRAVVDEAGGAAIDESARDGSAFRLRLVAHDEAAYDWFYNVVSNPMLWFLQHYLWELAYTPSVDVAFRHAWDEGYVRVNEGFAEAVLEELELEPDAAVFFHDYQLYLAPRIVRERAPDALLVHFVHIPWPQTDYWHVLPAEIRQAVHDGLLANDVVGFHSHRWRLNFLRTASDLAGASCDFSETTASYRGHRSLVTAHPISVDPGEFDELARSEEVLAAEDALVARRPEKLVVRVDRTDPSKNIVRGFRAFELYLDAHPEMHSRVGMLALLDPSRQDIPEYAEYLGAVQREARRVNDRFQQEGWMPIELVIEDDFAASVAAYKQFDALFVNAIFDGMNLIAKEAPLVNARDGVLILSENAGAHAELGDWALTVSPFDVAGQARAIDRALTMPAEERRERLGAIGEHVREHDLAAWIEAQLVDLDRCAAGVI